MIKDNSAAVIGMSFRYPHINSVSDLSKVMEEGIFLSNDNWRDRGALLNIPEYNKISGNAPLMDGIEFFDSKFFNVVEKEALEMTPEMKLALTHSALAVYDSGYSLADMKKTECGMVLASSSTAADYRRLTPNGSSTAYLDTRETMIGCKLSYYFGFSGPFFAVDSTCSSSLLAVKQAAEILATHQADVMLAGGVQLFLPNDAKRAHELFLGTEAVREKYIPFDENSTNLINGEGVGFVLLKRYADAVRDGDSIYGVITGCGMCGTRAEDRVSPYATDSVSQCKAIKRAWENAGVNADDITEIEAHGSATNVGDESEVKGFALAFKERKTPEKVILSSIKSNIGHTSQCAGISGLIKVLIGFRNNKAYQIANFRQPKKELDLEAAHLEPIGKTVDMQSGKHRTAGISGYGLNSLNVHIIVESCDEKNEGTNELSELNHVLKLSAKTETAFGEYVGKVREAVKAADDLDSMIYTLNVGRDDYSISSAVYFETREELLAALENVTAVSAAATEKAVIEAASDSPARAAYDAILAGKTVDFEKYYEGSSFKRVHTVPYQFDKLYTWIIAKQEVTEQLPTEPESAAAPEKSDTADIRSEMLKIWQSVLETDEEISDEDTFFELGGNSMLASVLIESVNDRFGSALEFGDIYNYSGFGQMCGYLEEN